LTLIDNGNEWVAHAGITEGNGRGCFYTLCQLLDVTINQGLSYRPVCPSSRQTGN